MTLYESVNVVRGDIPRLDESVNVGGERHTDDSMSLFLVSVTHDSMSLYYFVVRCDIR